MSISLYTSFLDEIQKPAKDRNKDLILQYLFSLKYFSLAFDAKNPRCKNIIEKIPGILSVQKTQKNEVLIQTGDKVNYFYLLLKGKATILFLNKRTFYMNENEYFSFLFELRLKKQFYLIKIITKLNLAAFPMFEEDFDTFIYNLSKLKTINFLYTKNKSLVQKAKEIYNEIKNEKSEINKLIFSPEEYINELSIPQFIIERSKKIKDENFFTKVTIPIYKFFRRINKGCTLGEKALECKDSCAKVSIICNDECDLGIINKDDYYGLLHVIFERIKKRFFNVISNFHIFSFLSYNLLEKKYYTFFVRKAYDRNHILFTEGKICRFIYLILNGEFELSVNKNIVEINELIIKYKKALYNIITYNNNNLNTKEINKYCNTNEETKQNEDLLLNPKKNKICFEKKHIKLGIFHAQEIMGLFDVFECPENCTERQFENLTSLLNCKCVNSNCEVYKFPLQMFCNIYNSENKIVEVTKELEKQKITYMIERLQKYKKYISFINVDKSEIFKNSNLIESYNNKESSNTNTLKSFNARNNNINHKNFNLTEFNKGSILTKTLNKKNEVIKIKLKHSSKNILPKLVENEKEKKSQKVSVTQSTEIESYYKKRKCNNFFDVLKKAKSTDQKNLTNTLINSLVYNNVFCKCVLNQNGKYNSSRKSQVKNQARNKIMKQLLKSEDCSLKQKNDDFKNKTNYSEVKLNKGKCIFNLKQSRMFSQRGNRNNGIYNALVFDEFTSSYNNIYKKFID